MRVEFVMPINAFYGFLELNFVKTFCELFPPRFKASAAGGVGFFFAAHRDDIQYISLENGRIK